MPDEILEYYERELAYLRKDGAAFAQRYSLIASRLLLEPDKCDDPHVERLLEGVAFLAARVHHKLDEEFPEITAALLHAVAPHLLSPIPSCSIVQLHRKPEAEWARVPRGVQLHTQPVRGHDIRCRFQTCAPVTLWPVELVAANFVLPSVSGLPSEVGTRSVLQLTFHCPLGALSELTAPFQVSMLRLYLDGDSQYLLYDLLFGGAAVPHAFVTAADGSLIKVALRPAGFGEDEVLLPASRPGLTPYLLLTEYFGFPAKFLFFDICDLHARTRAQLDTTFTVLVPLTTNQLPTVSATDFRLGCAPIINLFTQQAEPIALTQQQPEYRIIPDVRRQANLEVYSVDEVIAVAPGRSEPLHFRPFFSLKAGRLGDIAESRAGYFVASRRPSATGSEVYLSLVDMSFDPLRPPTESLLVTATCTNRDLAGRLPLGTTRRALSEDGRADLTLPGDFLLPATIVDAVAAVDCISRPTTTHRPSLRSSVYWRLVSHLSVNHLSLVDGEFGLRALHALLQLYEFVNPERVNQQLGGLLSLVARRTVARAGDGLPGFCRGVEITVQLDSERFVGGSQVLFEQILERFFGLYTTLNSFTQLVTVNPQQKELRRWPPRAGTQILI